MATAREPRKRLVPFLNSMIGQCPGVEWENQQELMFRIPWRHFKNREWAPADSQIFLEWARLTGKFNKGDKPDYPLWKTRLRCALNKIPEIKEIKRLHRSNDPNPYRVYQFVQSSPGTFDKDFSSDSCSNVSSPATSAGSESQPSPHMPLDDTDFLLAAASPHPQNQVSSQHLQQENPQIPTVVLDVAENNRTFNIVAYPTERREMNDLPPQTVDKSEQFCHNIFASEAVPSELGLSGFPSVEKMETNGSLPSDLKSLEDGDLVRVSPGENMPSMPSVNTPSFGSYTSVQQAERGENNTAVPNIPSVADEPAFNFSLWYGFNQKLCVMSGPISSQGCCLFTDPQKLKEKFVLDQELLGPREVEQLEMPSVNQCYGGEQLDEVQVKLISQLLDNMERGLVLMVKNHVLYAQRLCKTRIFVSDNKSTSCILERGGQKLIQIFDPIGNRDSSVFLTFGQEIKKDGAGKPMRRVLICLQIDHVKSKQNMDKIVLDSYANSNSLDQFISGNDGNDNLLDQLKNISVS
ncbi:interferon regulatory factor 7 [Aplysia californica]|uniref:Interferon regulatory factor 7 n=1 Tax=Aplysia californica TaxID=6500 RepID=A0ABM0J9Y9_APLCA|nr:interferon regulatory factor 7 [Aplysia californica]